MSSVRAFAVSVDGRCCRRIPTFRSDQSRQENQVSAIARRIPAPYPEWLSAASRVHVITGARAEVRNRIRTSAIECVRNQERER